MWQPYDTGLQLWAPKLLKCKGKTQTNNNIVSVLFVKETFLFFYFIGFFASVKRKFKIKS